MAKFKMTVVALAFLLIISTFWLIDVAVKKEPWDMYRHLSFQLAALAKKIEKRSNFGVRERRDSFVYASVLSVPTKRYHIDGCNCTRFGYNVEELEKAREAALKYPTTQPRWFLSKYPGNSTSTCSEFATQRGVGQKVVSYSYYHTEEKLRENSTNYVRFLANLYNFTRSVSTSFPGWLARVYHNTSADDEVAMKIICKIHCESTHIDLCHVNNLPGLGNLGKRQPLGRLWRFSVMGDPTVTQFMIRDCDSAIIPREITAVKEWLSSGRLFHVMRDHPLHKDPILAGLWGGHNANFSLMSSVRDDMFSEAPTNQPFASYELDQHLLATKLWPVIKNDTLRHETYYCKEFSDSKSFPTRRDDGLYIGYGPQKAMLLHELFRRPCPQECRKEKDWLYC